jgi:hypothetical protein
MGKIVGLAFSALNPIERVARCSRTHEPMPGIPVLSTNTGSRGATRMVRQGDGPPPQLSTGPTINGVFTVGGCEWAAS